MFARCAVHINKLAVDAKPAECNVRNLDFGWFRNTAQAPGMITVVNFTPNLCLRGRNFGLHVYRRESGKTMHTVQKIGKSIGPPLNPTSLQKRESFARRFSKTGRPRTRWTRGTGSRDQEPGTWDQERE